jgi:ElaB/YqjD/DUF883 family membrane-anchored ribosome-binding protein
VFFTLATTALVVFFAGCGKKKAASLQGQAKTAARDAGNAIKETSEKVVQDVKEAGQKVVQDVSDKAKEVAAPINAKAQETIDSAKKMVSDGKFQNALIKLKELGGEKLSTEQQAITDGLKVQIDKLLGTNKAAAEVLKAKRNELAE